MGGCTFLRRNNGRRGLVAVNKSMGGADSGGGGDSGVGKGVEGIEPRGIREEVLGHHEQCFEQRLRR